MKKLLLLISACYLLLVGVAGCKNDDRNPDSSAICDSVESGEFSEAKLLINRYLDLQRSRLNDEQKLEALRSWLESASCVSSAEILCNSCIETNPPISHIRLSFNVNGQLTKQTLDIRMGNPLKFGGFHE